jgi:hypothetical protein
MIYIKLALVVACAIGALADPQKNKGGAKAATAATAPTSTAAATAAADGNGGASLTLDAAAVQTGSDQDGTTGTGAEAGEAASQKSNDNFINFCSGKTLTNGLQVIGGSCNGIGKSYLTMRYGLS